jgi:hypothetical protein
VSQNLGEVLVAELRRFLAPIVEAGDDRRALELLLADLGFDAHAITATEQVAALAQAARDAVGALDQIQLPPDSLDDLRGVLSATTSVRDAVHAASGLVEAFPATLSPPLDGARIAADTLNLLAVRYLTERLPIVGDLLALLGVIHPRDPSELPVLQVASDTGEIVRFPPDTPIVELRRLGALLGDPVANLRDVYRQGAPAATARTVAARLFPLLEQLLDHLGGDFYVLDPATLGADQLGQAGSTAALATGVARFALDPDLLPIDPANAEFGLVLTLSPADAGGLGIAVRPFGSLALATEVAGWDLEVVFAAAGGTVTFTLSEVQLGDEPADLNAILSLRRADGQGRPPALLLGGQRGTHAEVGDVRIAGTVHVQDGQPPELGVSMQLDRAAVVLAAGDGDGFLARVLPADGVRAELDLIIGWSNRRGLHVHGGAGLEAAVPIHASFLGVLDLDTIHLAVKPSLTGPIQLMVAASATVSLGPFAVAIDRTGLAGTVAFPPGGGNVGPMELDLRFKPPAGVGLAIEAPSVTGGGYLFFDQDREEYAGIVQLELAGLAISAIGLITTRPGEFSLLLIISVEFSPIQLGYGFTLNGVGGLLGVNRTIAIEEIRGGLKQGALDAILFPRDPVRNAPQVIAALGRFFPAAQGQYVFGPSAIIGWGSPTVLTITLGILIEFPSPVRLVLAGQLRMALPDPEEPVAILQMDLLGSLDFAEGRLAIDASLRDSRVAAFAIAGDVAIRADWGEEPGFLLAAGGFHPRFRPPATLRALDRLSISLANGDNPRIRLEAYLALTSNTVQFGARLDIYAEADLGIGKFSVAAWLGFDALFQFSPFAFVVDIYAGVALKWNDAPFLSVDLALTLSGPTPWRADGTATFHFLGTHTIQFELVIGEEPPPQPPELVDVLDMLKKALQDPRSWEAQRPPDGHTLVTLRARPPGEDVVVHPLGTLTVRQRVVPLQRDITRYGAGRPNAPRFTIGRQAPDGSTKAPDAIIEDLFAPAQFFDMSDADRLTAPSFEQMAAGARFGSTGLRVPSAGIRDIDALVYEERLVDVADREPNPPPPAVGGEHVLAEADLPVMARGGAVARNGAASAGIRPYVGDPLDLAVHPLEFRVVDVDAMSSAAGVPDHGLPWSQAVDLLTAQLAVHPDLAGALQVVPAFEVRS